MSPLSGAINLAIRCGLGVYAVAFIWGHVKELLPAGILQYTRSHPAYARSDRRCDYQSVLVGDRSATFQQWDTCQIEWLRRLFAACPLESTNSRLRSSLFYDFGRSLQWIRGHSSKALQNLPQLEPFGVLRRVRDCVTTSTVFLKVWDCVASIGFPLIKVTGRKHSTKSHLNLLRSAHF